MKYWKWCVGIPLGTLTVIVVAIMFIGSSMPEHHVATRTVEINASPEAVWEAITDIDNATNWNPHVASIERLPDIDGKQAWVEVSTDGDRTPVRVVVWEPPTRLVTQVIDEGQPFSGTWTTEITPKGDDSVVTITENASIHHPFIRVLFYAMVDKYESIDRFLVSLGKKFGETVQPL
ncbi:MAG: SRPBCC family protein [Candidatus Poribacteria bacterium]|nr:SRPBCC family protein [Candidatus Poribacteria bacterium]